MNNRHLNKAPTLHLQNNPDFNEALIFCGLEAISFRDRKRIQEFRNNLKSILSQIKLKCKNWPYKKRVMIVIEIQGPTKLYSRRDVDNMSKAILDAGNKIIYDDDRMIDILIVQKRVWKFKLYGFHIGITEIDLAKKKKYSPEVCFKSKDRSNIPANSAHTLSVYFKDKAGSDYIVNPIQK